MRTVRLFVGLLVIECIASLAWAQAPQNKPCTDPCGQPTAWQDFNTFTIRVAPPGSPEYSEWRGSLEEKTGDLQFTVEQSDGKSVVNGKILLIGGRVMATQGPIAKPGYEIDALDAFSLRLQLVMKVLGRAYPDGPASTKPIQDVDYSDDKTGIEIATQSARGMIRAPWHVAGTLRQIQDGAIQYDLTLTAKKARDDTRIWLQLSGTLSNRPNAKIDDQLSLENWKLYAVGPQSHKQGDSTIFDYSAVPEATTYKTVADVRKALQAEDYVGEADASKDFTGFWETRCDDGFGLQIMHFGSDGKYSIAFCGPGGCDDPSEAQKTFITHDPKFQVVSEDELKEKTTDGWDVYHRCTKETHPALRLKQKP